MDNYKLLENMFSATAKEVENLDDEGLFAHMLLTNAEVQHMLEEGQTPTKEQLQIAITYQEVIIEMNVALKEQMLKKYLEL